jgi:hypothetical protein
VATAELREIPTLRTATITPVSTATTVPAPTESAARPRTGLALLYLLNGALIGVVLWWIRRERRQ